MSSFDDLLSELDAAPPEKQTEENPLRNDCLRRLVDLSKNLEKIALILDPSEKKHPLHGQTVPAEARGNLKTLVNELMQVQGDLQKIEESLLTPESEHSLSAEPTESIPSPEITPVPTPPPVVEEPLIPAAPAAPSIDPVLQAEFDKEKTDFSAYKSQWETVFTADPAQRAAHPEVQAYYDQMEAYFLEKAKHLTAEAK